jgi:hypothetical protein
VAKQTEAAWGVAESTSYVFNVDLQSVTETSAGSVLADVSFTSLQSPSKGPNGDSCDDWTLAYTLVQLNGSWVIQQATGQGATTYQTC